MDELEKVKRERDELLAALEKATRKLIMIEAAFGYQVPLLDELTAVIKRFTKQPTR